ncbi:FtsL-like putative cell division protein [Fulvivirgaceae bacterium BMA10]|uniref:FtsL-like putative cell division protein n=1 Tax=Splendidivirga corallicola TaxID=3051826 RepID=A0ABT8KL43_9BACT|nr:FtsL-like putative cell division protein [Fulvivirgaceae bacterium BMA10]
MTKNTYRVSQNNQNRKSVFSFIEKHISINGLFENGLPIKYLPYILFISAIGICYIGNVHYAEKTIRKIDKIKEEVEDLRADFRTLQADYMHARLQSEVAKKVENLGLKESSKPPVKIIVKKGEY